MLRSRLLSCLLLTTALTVAGPAFAQKLPERKPGATAEQPVLLNANMLTYDEGQSTITAEGEVVLIQNGQTVQADRMTYNRNTGIVVAEGHVKFWQKSGEVLFSDYIALSRDLRQAFVNQASILMTDNSRFIAMEGERTEGRYIRLNRAIYSACDLCKEDPSKPPLWQLKAERIVHDSESKDVIYRNATLEMGGVPVFYTPYLSHPDPTVKRRSGFLNPVVGSKTDLGFVVRNYYYLDVAPTMDATFEGSFSAERGVLLGAEWRQKTERADIKVNVSGNIDDNPDDMGGTAQEDTLRGRFFLDASYEIDPNWRASASIKRTTDDTFLDIWNYSDADVLPSTAKLEYFSYRGHGEVAIRSYQDLRPGITTPEPNVMTAGYSVQGAPRDTLGGRWSLGAETRTVARSRGLDSERLALEAGWQREDIAPAGIVVTTDLTARADTFLANNLNGDDPTEFRPFIQGQVTARWPWVKVTDRGQQFFEPIAQLSAAPRQKRDPDDIANEDSIGLEFDNSNLFAPNRYAGDDRIDGGQRVAYGVRGGWTGNSGASVTLSAGQSYDFADNPNYADGTGLDEPFSDYIGSVDLSLPEIADLTYTTRYDRESFRPHEHDVRAVLGPSKLQAYVNYLYLDQTTADGAIASRREELGAGGRWRFADYWNVMAYHRRNIEAGEALSTSLSLNYEDECLVFSLVGARDHVARSGLESGDSIFFRLMFKTLGAFESPSLSPDMFSKSEN